MIDGIIIGGVLDRLRHLFLDPYGEPARHPTRTQVGSPCGYLKAGWSQLLLKAKVAPWQTSNRA